MIGKFLTASRGFLVSAQSEVLSAAAVISFLMLGSQVLGIVRDRALIRIFGYSSDLGVYHAAFRIPDSIFQLLVLGTISTAFIPVFSNYLGKGKKGEAHHIASSTLNLGAAFFGILAVLAFLFALPLSDFITAGNLNADELFLMVNLTRLMLFAQFLFLLSNFLTGILQSYQRFLLPAIAPIFYNLGIISGTLLWGPILGVYGPALGVLLGAFLHFAVQWPLLKSLAFAYCNHSDYRHPAVREIGRLVLPRAFGLGVTQIDQTVDLALAAFISTPAIIALNFAQHLQGIPVRLVGLSVAQASLPLLSTLSGLSLPRFRETLLSSCRQIVYLTLPTSVVLIVLRVPIVRLAFGDPSFSWLATVVTGKTLALFALSGVAQSLILLLGRAFYALKDTLTPVKIGIVAVATNVILSIVFVLFLGFDVWGLALSASIAAGLNASGLFFFLQRRLGGLFSPSLVVPLLKMLTASLLMAVLMYLPFKFLDLMAWSENGWLKTLGLPRSFELFVLDTRYTINLIFFSGIVMLWGGFVYLMSSRLLGIGEAEVYFGVLRRLKASWHEMLSYPLFFLKNNGGRWGKFWRRQNG